MQAEESRGQFSYFLFHFMGASSTLGLLMVILYSVASIFEGDFMVWSKFLQTYPGSQPFLIFIAPVILVSSLAWLVFLYRKTKNSSQ